jgi:hypothetical protein
MNFALSAGTIHIDVLVARGRVCAVEVKAERPRGLARLFDGREPNQAPELAGQLFSLCGFSQSSASLLAIAEARGEPLSTDRKRDLAVGIFAERVFETLRALVMQWPTGPAGRHSGDAARGLRQALAASQTLVARARAQAGDYVGAATDLEDAARLVGATGDAGPDTLCGRIAAELSDNEAFHHPVIDCLLPEDDCDVLEGLLADEDFAMRPSLRGRVIETGAYAHLGEGRASGLPYLAARFAARIQDIRTCLSSLAALATGRACDISDLASSGALAEKRGYGAVECARGRLYHVAGIGPDGRIAGYRILAPTEWNFHPAGPFVEQLLSSRIGAGEGARQNIARLAALFDPCVAFDVRLEEMADA